MFLYLVPLLRPDIVRKAPFFRLFARYKSSGSSKRWLRRQKNDIYSREAKHENLKSRAAFKLLQIDQQFKLFHSPGGVPLNVVDLGAAPGAWNQVALDKCPRQSKILGVDILPYQPPRGVSSMQANILSKRTHENIRNFFQKKDNKSMMEEFEDVEITTVGGKKLTVTEGTIQGANSASIDTYSRPQDKSPGSNQPVDSEQEKHLEEAKNWPVDVVLSDMMANTSGLAVRDHEMSMDLCDAALIVAIDLLKKNGKLVIKFFTGVQDKYLEQRLKVVFHKVQRFKPSACRRESKECYFVCLGKKSYYVDKLIVFRKA
ncbi:MRM2 [Brettanomyces bruxellensis]|uniref:rRNA methyltransferase 2, mitochondrial n=1 Tax=Dekkera bruxellensis TaxID=5007 RepID=A0A7D9CZZ5_DEKBR|nr:MRM2 [Brettanomyces bruxellensis]